MTALRPVDAQARLSFLDQVHERTESMREEARVIAGTGGPVDRRRLLPLLRAENARVYPLVAIFGLGLVQVAHGEAYAVLAPDLGATFGLSPQFFTVINLASQVITFLVPLAVARFVQNRACRAAVMLISAGIFTALMPLTALVTAPWMLILVQLADDTTSSAHATVSSSLTIDLYPPRARVRVISVFMAAGTISLLLAQALVVLLTGPANLNWRGVFVVLGALALVFYLAALGLRDPGYGHYDTEVLRKRVQETAPGPSQVDRGPAETGLTLVEAIRRIWHIRTVRYSLVGVSVTTMQAPIAIYLSFYLTYRFELDAFERSLLAFSASLFGVLAFVVLAPIGDRIFQRNPGRLFVLSGLLGVLGLPLNVLVLLANSVWQLVALQLVSALMGGLIGPAMVVGKMSVVPGPLRAHLGAIAALFTLGAAAVSTALLAGLASTLNLLTAVVITNVLALVGIVIGMMAGRQMRPDQDAMLEEVIEEEAIAQLRDQSVPIPVVAARGIDFSYGSTQVLFGVDFFVDEAERVALLGVNGAGKSTLLRVISGLGLPQRGSVRLAGSDITFHDAHRRTSMGIVQIPGGRAVFNELSVVETLRCYGFQLDRRTRDLRIDDAFATFPQLEPLRNRSAAVLSGGQQQMLGLAKAVMLKPRVLLIDELSLGLAPVVVDELLEAVRRINAEGTAIVLVEQSVNVALSITERAYFMEHGRVRFEGRSDSLLQEEQLLRSVFLSGAASRIAR